ncbi:cytochrome P450 [Leptolyngbya ohadii]|uniref:cytochrome P450 n=1 Tax=Leptolyngbya ohadii TaxID=1962290 RepID=UPI000B59B22D|nr:cytochrome P450 [Leptolyngbya ohadii]
MTSQITPPGQQGLPLLGETLAFFSDPDFARKRHQQYGPIFKTQLLGSPTVFLKGPEATYFVLIHENKYFVVSWPPSVKKLLGPLSLALQSGEVHVQRRKLMAQAFQPRALANYLPAMEAISNEYLQRWTALETLTWYPELRNYTFDVACKLLIGLDQASQTELGHWFEIWTQGLFSIPVNLPWTQFGKAYRGRQQLLDGLEALIRERQQQADPGNDALGVLLQAQDEEGNQLSLEELKDQVLLLLFAGHETLTSALASFCLLLAQHPDVKARARAEQAKFAGMPLTLETLKEMTYLEQILKEVLRCVAPVGGGFREVIETCELGGFTIPKGWKVLYEINLTHQDSEIFANPEQFDPDRFSAERSEDKVKPFSHVPFGGGLRECLGKEFARLEMKLFAAKLLQGYDWTLLPQDLTMVVVPTPKPKDGLKVRFESLTV